jgi:SH3 domain protein
MFSKYTIVCSTALILFLTTTVSAETLYISDTLVITVRDSKSDDYKTLESVKTNTPIQVLDQDDKFVRGKTPKGTVGFILKQYLTSATPKTITIQRLEEELKAAESQLEKEQQRYQSDLGDTGQLSSQLETLTAELDTTTSELDNIQTAYRDLSDRSQNVVALSQENQQLSTENEQLSQELDILREENQNFHRSNMLQWFIAGAAVFFGGWVIGKISRQKQRKFSSM